MSSCTCALKEKKERKRSRRFKGLKGLSQNLITPIQRNAIKTIDRRPSVVCASSSLMNATISGYPPTEQERKSDSKQKSVVRRAD